MKKILKFSPWDFTHDYKYWGFSGRNTYVQSKRGNGFRRTIAYLKRTSQAPWPWEGQCQFLGKVFRNLTGKANILLTMRVRVCVNRSLIWSCRWHIEISYKWLLIYGATKGSYGATEGSKVMTQNLKSGISQKWCKIEISCQQKSNRLLHMGCQTP